MTTLVAEAQFFRALVTAGSVLASLGGLPENERDFVRCEIRSLFRAADRLMLAQARLEAEQRLDRLHRLLRYSSSKYEVEEVVLMLTIRLELALASHSVGELFTERWDHDLIDCDEVLVEMASSRANRGSYRSAVSLIERNWRRRTPFSVEALKVSDVWNA